MGARTKARKRALDMLYVADVRQVPLQEVLDEEARRAVAQPQRASSWPYAEQIVRGVIDLVFWERDGWVITDYKTDRAALDQLSQLTEHYRPQVDTYAQIWSDITGQAVREKGLFFTAVQRYVTL